MAFEALVEFDELGGGEFVVLFELAAEMRGAFVAELEGDVLDSVGLAQEELGGDHALLVEPLLGRAAEDGLGLAFELAGGDTAELGEAGDVELGLFGQTQPGALVLERGPPGSCLLHAPDTAEEYILKEQLVAKEKGSLKCEVQSRLHRRAMMGMGVMRLMRIRGNIGLPKFRGEDQGGRVE